MSSNWQSGGPNHVPAYQMSGVPFVTSSAAGEVKAPATGNKPIEIDFPYVTKFVTVRNTGENELRVAFSFSGSYAPGEDTYPAGSKPNADAKFPGWSGKNYFLIPTGSGNQGHPSIQTFDVRCKKIVFQSNAGTTDFTLLAGLTNIPAHQFPVLTGSITGSATSRYTDGVLQAFKGIG